jgi:hypothetical protein
MRSLSCKFPADEKADATLQKEKLARCDYA